MRYPAAFLNDDTPHCSYALCSLHWFETMGKKFQTDRKEIAELKGTDDETVSEVNIYLTIYIHEFMRKPGSDVYAVLYNRCASRSLV